MIAAPRDCSVELLTKHCRRKKCSVDRCACGRYRSDEAATTMRMPRHRRTIATHIATSSRNWFASDRESCADHLRQIDLAIGLGEQQHVGVETAILNHGVLRVAGRMQHFQRGPAM